jgi:hypothetical protein
MYKKRLCAKYVNMYTERYVNMHMFMYNTCICISTYISYMYKDTKYLNMYNVQ